MIMDFHVHGKITSKFDFDEEKFLLTINEAKNNGLDSLAITEHCGCYKFEAGYVFLNNNFKRISDYYDVNGLKIFYGMEVTTKQDLDILIIGKSELVISLREKIIDNLNDNEFIDINVLFDLDISRELLVILAHPYRSHNELPYLSPIVVGRLDAVELNSKDIYKYGMNEMLNKVADLSKKLNLPITAGSDTHYFIQVSTARNVFKKDCNTVKELKEEILLRNYDINFSTDLNERVQKAIIAKNKICGK